MSRASHETGSHPGEPSGPLREAVEHLLGSMDGAREPIADLRAALETGGCGAALVLGTTAALGVCESAAAFLELAAAARKGPPARYRVTCPECGAGSMTVWPDVLPPGGVSPVECSARGYMILSESEGDPVPLSGGGA